MGDKIYDIHHVVPRSRDGSNAPDNKVRLDQRVHRALHMIFANQTPIEQIQRIIGINSTALTHQFKEDVGRILLLDDPDYVYKRGIIRKR